MTSRSSRPGGSGRWPIAAASVLVLALLAGCTSGKGGSGDSAEVNHSGGTLRLAVTGLTSYDPATVVPTDQAEMVAADLVSDGLTAIDAQSGAVVPSLAESWAADDAGTRWTFTLRDGAMFSDGSPVTAADVVTALSRVAARGSATLAAARLEEISGYADLVAGRTTSLAGLEAVDDRTLTITTTSSDVELPLLLGSPVYGVMKVSPTAEVTTTASTAAPGSAGVDGGALTGSGPFAVASDDGTTLHLVRVSSSVAELDGVDLVRVADGPAADAAVRDGSADWAPLSGVTAAAAASASSTSTSTATTDSPGTTGPDGTAPADSTVVKTAPLGAEEFFGMNVANPVLTNPVFRQAIVKGIDRAKLVTLGPAGLRPSSAVVPPGVPGAVDDPCGSPCAYDPAAAKALVAQAFPGGGVPTVDVDTDDDPADVALANAVQASLVAIGVPANVVVKPFAEYQRFVTTGQQQLFRTGWVGMAPSPGSYLDPLFRSNSLDNLTALASASVDTRLGTARATKDDAARVAQYQALEKDVLALWPVVPLGSYVASVRLSARVEHYVQRLDGTFDALQVQVGSS